MKQLVTLTIVFSLLGLMSCEPCEDQGKENINITVIESIDSVNIISAIQFNLAQSDISTSDFYSSGFINTSEKSLRIEVYLDSIQTTFDFDIVPDAYHSIFIADSASIACLSEEDFELATRNNINTCYQARFLECP